jgi:ribosomal protein S17E
MTELEKTLKQFVIQIEPVIAETTRREEKYRKDLHDLQRQNKHLLKKLAEINSKPDINDNELYLIDKIERLERELKQRDEYINALVDSHSYPQ